MSPKLVLFEYILTGFLRFSLLIMIAMLVVCIVARIIIPIEEFHSVIEVAQLLLGLENICSLVNMDLIICTVAMVPWVAVTFRFLMEFYVFNKQKFHLLVELQRLSLFLQQQNQLAKEVHKALQFLRDREVVQRGYTMQVQQNYPFLAVLIHD